MFKMAPQKYSGDWPEIFRAEASALRTRVGSSVISIEHIGSTSVAGLSAKPILDILVEVAPGALAQLTQPLQTLGFKAEGENGIAGRAYFTRAATLSAMALHLHAFESGSPELVKHLAFRDFLRAHPAVLAKYQTLKQNLLSKPKLTREEYQQEKAPFIADVVARAIVWHTKRLKEPASLRKAVVYAIRDPRAPEVLVFDQVQFPEVSPQVPAGTIEATETPAEGALREFYEETGKVPNAPPTFLGSYVFYKKSSDQFHERFCFFTPGNHLPTTWTHLVTGTGQDRSLEFRYYWLPLIEAEAKLQAGLGDGLGFFRDRLDFA